MDKLPVYRKVDWNKTKFNLANLRLGDSEYSLNLRRFVCRFIREPNEDNPHADFNKQCPFGLKCENCATKEPLISCRELGLVFGHSDENIVSNWENGRTIPDIEDILFYSIMSKMPIDQILEFKKNK